MCCTQIIAGNALASYPLSSRPAFHATTSCHSVFSGRLSRTVLSPTPAPVRVDSAAAGRAHGKPIAGLHLAALAEADIAHSTVQQLRVAASSPFTRKGVPVRDSPYARPATTEPSPRRLLASFTSAEGQRADPPSAISVGLVSPVRSVLAMLCHSGLVCLCCLDDVSMIL
jgi:hypothetical protein